MNSRAVVDPPALDVVAPTTVRRDNFNYSVIAGGAFSGPELELAVKRDAVVAEHYRDVDASTMRPEILKADRLVYVSYRLGDRVYWTSKKVRIRSGETILSNGRQEIRARCGNYISLEPLMPTSEEEPDPMQLEALADTAPVLVASSLNPLRPFAPGDPVDDVIAPLEIPQHGIPLLPFPAGFTGTAFAAPGATDPDRPIDVSLHDAGQAVIDTTVPVGAGTLAGGATSLLPGDPIVLGFADDASLPFHGSDLLFDETTTRFPPPPTRNDAIPVPEPATLLLLGGGIAALVARRWRDKKS